MRLVTAAALFAVLFGSAEAGSLPTPNLGGGATDLGRIFSSRANDIINVLDSMTPAQVADVQSGTGSIDVTAALQTAAHRVPSCAAGGGELFFPAGRYKVRVTGALNVGGSVVINSCTHVVGVGSFGSTLATDINLPVLINPIRNVLLNSIVSVVLPAGGRDHDITIEGINFDSTNQTAFDSGNGAISEGTSILFGQNIKFINNTSTGQSAPVASPMTAVQCISCVGFEAYDNSAYVASVGIDTWQGPKNIRIHDNHIEVLGNGLGQQCINVNGQGTATTSINVTQDVHVNNNECVLAGGNAGIDVDTLNVGSVLTNADISGNLIRCTGGTANTAIVARGFLSDVTFDRNQIIGCVNAKNPQVLIQGQYSASITPTNPITTTSGSPSSNINFPAHGLVPGQSLYVGATTAVGGVTFSSTYKITAVPDVNNVTIASPGTATSTATGGGATTLFGWSNAPRRISFRDNHFVNDSVPSTQPMAVVSGESNVIAGNTADDTSSFGVFIGSDAYDPGNTVVPNILSSNQASAGSAAQGSTVTVNGTGLFIVGINAYYATLPPYVMGCENRTPASGSAGYAGQCAYDATYNYTYVGGAWRRTPSSAY